MIKASNDGSVAPKERVNIKYTPAASGEQSEKELPLRLLFVGDFTGRDDETPVELRKAVSISKNNFSAAMEEQNISLDVVVPDMLSGKSDAELGVHLKLKSLNDFSPDAVVKQVPEISKLMELREALNALKGPLGNVPSFRRAIQDIIADEGNREKILKELSVSCDSERVDCKGGTKL